MRTVARLQAATACLPTAPLLLALLLLEQQFTASHGMLMLLSATPRTPTTWRGVSCPSLLLHTDAPAPAPTPPHTYAAPHPIAVWSGICVLPLAADAHGGTCCAVSTTPVLGPGHIWRRHGSSSGASALLSVVLPFLHVWLK